MILPTIEKLKELLKARVVSKRVIKELRYNPESVQHVEARDFLWIADKSGNEGVLYMDDMVAQGSIRPRKPNATGKIEAIVCDICKTWRRGSESAVLTLKKSSTATVSYLVCADMDCSLHVRDMTTASKLSRTQLREHIAPQARAERLRGKLTEILRDV